MADHFAAFSFVDRITEYEPGRRARGRYAVPADIAAFPSCLVAEAVGQLAAWVAMAHIGFRGRPVAALANETRFRADVAPGEHARARRRHRKLRRARGRLRRPRVGRWHGRRSSSSIASVRCCRSRSSIRRRRWRSASSSSVAKARRPAASTASRRAARRAHRGRARRVGERDAARARIGAVLRRSLPAPSGLSGDAAARCADPLRARARGRGDALARGNAARAVPDDAREDALVHSAGRHARHRRRARAARQRTTRRVRLSARMDDKIAATARLEVVARKKRQPMSASQ